MVFGLILSKISLYKYIYIKSRKLFEEKTEHVHCTKRNYFFHPLIIEQL